MFGALFVSGVALRLSQHHAALLYPDGYQYLLMARGIAEHLTPTTVLGAGGDRFVPSADAAAKPLFPLLVAGLHLTGIGLLSAARIVTCVAAAAAVVCLAALTTRVTGSLVAGCGSGLLLLASPSATAWSGFSGPDPLAQAMALGSALAFAFRRPRLGGTLAALAVATRPELVLLCAVGAIVAASEPEARHAARAAVLPFATTLAIVFGVLRPPVALPDIRLASVGLACVAAAGLVAMRTRLHVVLLGLSVLLPLAVATSPALRELARTEWPLLGLGIAAFVLLACRPERRMAALVVGSGLGMLALIYALKSPGNVRYMALLLPLPALLAGIGIAALSPRMRGVALVGVGLAVAAGFGRSQPTFDHDPFVDTAGRLAPHVPQGQPLVTASPDAYGFLLPTYAVVTARPGARGVVLLDAAQRAYAPHLRTVGRIVARLESRVPFVRPDGELDTRPATLVLGAVVRG